VTSDQGRTPEERLPARTPDERLPARRPPSQPAPVERFSAPPQQHTFELSPERAAKIVRQSSNARWIGFLATIIVVLFVVVYYFYELGAPLGLTKARLAEELDAQQVTAVERGYNLFEANCARCHGQNGEGGVGPVLNDQEKLFQHLNEDYLRNVLNVGGRYVCGNANSVMPVWSNENGGPLNYRQIEEIIAFIRAPSNQEFVVRDPSLNEPVIDPATGKEKTFHGWVDPNYQPAPGSTPFPDCYLNALTGGASGSPGASGAPAASIDPNAPVVKVTAPSGAATAGFDPTTLEAKANEAFTLDFDNQDSQAPHNVVIQDASGAKVSQQGGDTAFFTGPADRKYPVAGLKAGDYTYVCQVHPTTMKGTLTVK
jgi:mono/diheme cytochrome c family protein/plastocyanin